MRGKPERQLAMLMSLSTEDLIPAGHPIRRIRRIVEEVMAELDGEFDAMYSRIGRPSIPPEQLLKATVLMALYSMRSERAFCERLNYDLLFKWFLDLPIDAKAFDPSSFTKNRNRLLGAEIADRFFAAVVRQAQLRRYVSSEHFSVDGTLLNAWASHKTFKPKDGPPPDTPAGRNAEVQWRGHTRQRSAIDRRTTRHRGHETSLRIRKRIEEPFGWIKTIGGGRKLRYIGRQRNRAWFKITAAVYNLIRITALDLAAT